MKGFNFGNDDPVTPQNVEWKAMLLMEQLLERSKWYRTPHVLIPLGNDFAYQNASIIFNNMSIVMKYVNERSSQYQDAKVFYSTLPEYFESVFSFLSNVSFPEYDGDFLPYTSFLDTWWTGFYTSRFLSTLCFSLSIHLTFDF